MSTGHIGKCTVIMFTTVVYSPPQLSCRNSDSRHTTCVLVQVGLCQLIGDISYRKMNFMPRPNPASIRSRLHRILQ